MPGALAVAHYRSIRSLVLPLGRLTLVTGANGSGKSNLYRALRLLAEVACGGAVAALAREGGLESVLWAGPETFSAAMRRGDQPVQGGPRRKPVALRLGFLAGSLGYAIDLGLPVPTPGSMFDRDPAIKREAVWHGATYHASRALLEREGPLVRGRDDTVAWRVLDRSLPAWESVLSRVADPLVAPEALQVREALHAWRFYDHFRCDPDSPARHPQVGVRTPVLGNDGADLAAAWRTIVEIGDGRALGSAIDDAFPGARVTVEAEGGRFSLLFHQPGLLRPLRQAELSDGTLRYLLLTTALLTPRPPPLMVFNEPEGSLHPGLLAPLGRLMRAYADHAPLWVVSHAPALQEALLSDAGCTHLRLVRELGETRVDESRLPRVPGWRWPGR